MLIGDKFPQLDTLRPRQTDEPLPDIQELRQQFIYATRFGRNDTERVRYALEHIDYLNRTVDTADGSINSRIFFNSVVVTSNSFMSDAYRDVLLQLPPDQSSDLRLTRFSHTLASVAARKRIQQAIAESLIAHPDTPVQKHFHRISKITESAISSVFGESGGREFIRGLVTERRVLDALHQMGLIEARYATEQEDAGEEIDILVPVARSIGSVAIQVKSHDKHGVFVARRTSPSSLRLVIGDNPNSPYELTRRQRGGLRKSLDELAA